MPISSNPGRRSGASSRNGGGVISGRGREPPANVLGSDHPEDRPSLRGPPRYAHPHEFRLLPGLRPAGHLPCAAGIDQSRAAAARRERGPRAGGFGRGAGRVFDDRADATVCARHRCRAVRSLRLAVAAIVLRADAHALDAGHPAPAGRVQHPRRRTAARAFGVGRGAIPTPVGPAMISSCRKWGFNCGWRRFRAAERVAVGQ